MTDLDDLIVEAVRAARRIAVGLIGSTVVLIGVVLIVLPGPAFVVIPIGVGILAMEFRWARRLLRRARQLYRGGEPPAEEPREE